MEYDVDVEFSMQILYIAKSFYDHGKLKNLLGVLNDRPGNDISLAEDQLGFIEVAAVQSAFEDTMYYYQCGQKPGRENYLIQRDVYVLRDPLLTRYDSLCRKLEMKLGITKVENQFARDMESAIQRNLQLNSYSYDYRWIDGTGDRKGAKIVLFLFEEFCAYYDIPDALFSILDFCAEGIPKLEAALAEISGDKVIRLPIETAPEKEAA